MSTRAFISRVACHAGISIERAERVTRVVLSGVGSYLTTAIGQLVADELPPALGMALLDASDLGAPLEERVLQVGATAGRAHELIASVCCVLAEELSTRTLLALRAAMPPPLAKLLATPARGLAARLSEPRRDATLATHRSGQPPSDQ